MIIIDWLKEKMLMNWFMQAFIAMLSASALTPII